MDVMADTLSDGRAFLTLNIVDDFTRECVAIEVDRLYSAKNARAAVIPKRSGCDCLKGYSWWNPPKTDLAMTRCALGNW
jgi:hypothetical protein